ncbi:MAG: hypothetical protein K2M19_04495 [Muribaculaceae bacterium]|nr:hypothetical protein [Muribaculaceae bacterium]
MKSYAAIIILIYLLATGCGHSSDPSAHGATPRPLLELLNEPANPANPYSSRGSEAPDEGCERIRIRQIGPLRKVFNDSNHVHLEAARALGIDPLKESSAILSIDRPLVTVTSCQEFYLDNLTHSFGYLVPEADELLHEIGRRFNDSLQARGGGAYRMKVTSVLRTPASVRKLRRVNVNATEESTHMFGTTFDISYSKFICDDPEQPHRTFEDLKNLLAEVLYDLRAEGRCYVKYEAKQSCFHITARPQPDDNRDHEAS